MDEDDAAPVHVDPTQGVGGGSPPSDRCPPSRQLSRVSSLTAAPAVSISAETATSEALSAVPAPQAPAPLPPEPASRSVHASVVPQWERTPSLTLADLQRQATTDSTMWDVSPPSEGGRPPRLSAAEWRESLATHVTAVTEAMRASPPPEIVLRASSPPEPEDEAEETPAAPAGAANPSPNSFRIKVTSATEEMLHNAAKPPRAEERRRSVTYAGAGGIGTGSGTGSGTGTGVTNITQSTSSSRRGSAAPLDCGRIEFVSEDAAASFAETEEEPAEPCQAADAVGTRETNRFVRWFMLAAIILGVVCKTGLAVETWVTSESTTRNMARQTETHTTVTSGVFRGQREELQFSLVSDTRGNLMIGESLRRHVVVADSTVILASPSDSSLESDITAVKALGVTSILLAFGSVHSLFVPSTIYSLAASLASLAVSIATALVWQLAVRNSDTFPAIMVNYSNGTSSETLIGTLTVRTGWPFYVYAIGVLAEFSSFVLFIREMCRHPTPSTNQIPAPTGVLRAPAPASAMCGDGVEMTEVTPATAHV